MRFFCFLLFTLSYQIIFSQSDSILVGGSFRKFILHLPDGYTNTKDYPLVINMHGLGSNAFEQQLYSQFDAIANAQDFIVAYPDAIGNNWDLFGTNDTEFIDRLVDSLRDRYSANNCLFFMGMSQGGFMSYKFACEFPRTVTAIASVTGTMTTPLQITCDPFHPIPVMQFHGTADQVVPYNGTFGVPPIEETIQWWVDENNCNADPAFTSIPDIDQGDNSTAELYYYNECSEESEVIFYKITNGGHSWPGAFPIASFGNTNQDIDASELIGDFFASHCTSITGLQDAKDVIEVSVFPNPANDLLTVSWPGITFNLSMFDTSGRQIFSHNGNHGNFSIGSEKLINGIYFIRLHSTEGIMVNKRISISK